MLIALHMEEILTDLGHAVVGIARTMAEAMTLAQAHSLDLATVDRRLARGDDGLEVAGRLLAEHGIPSVMVTGSVDAGLRAQAGEIGAPVLSKPIDRDALAAILHDADGAAAERRGAGSAG